MKTSTEQGAQGQGVVKKTKEIGLGVRFLKRLKQRFKFKVSTENQQMEAYFAQATDIYDLEECMRSWERKRQTGIMNHSKYWA